MTAPCESFIPDLVDAADGRPSPFLEAHLRTCASCRARVTAFEDDLAKLDPGPAPEPGPWLAGRVRARAEARRLRGQRILVAGLPAVALTAVLVIVFFPPRRAPEPQAPAALWAEVARDLMGEPAAYDETEALDLETVQAWEAAWLPPGADAVDPEIWDPTWSPDVHEVLAGADEEELRALLEVLPG